jgi:uncharacterized protein
MSDELEINGTEIRPGSRQTLGVPIPSLNTNTSLTMPVHVIRGKKEGARLMICAAIHGDELNGVEIIRRILNLRTLARLRGTLIAVPVVNVYGLLEYSRYLPDRRDLNRRFPGSVKGSMASRLAKVFMDEIVLKSTHGIDLHSGSMHRSNLPQIRGDLTHEETHTLARTFGAPVTVHSTIRDGSLREAAADKGIPMLLYEAGQALRFDEMAIRVGVRGVVNVLRELDMLPRSRNQGSKTGTIVTRSSRWVRASESGMLWGMKPLGDTVHLNEVLGEIHDPFGTENTEILSPLDGIIIGRTEMPLVHEGEALFHIASYKDIDGAAHQIENFQEYYVAGDEPGLDIEQMLD